MPAHADERVVATRVQGQFADGLIALPRDHALRGDRAVVEKTAYPFELAVDLLPNGIGDHEMTTRDGELHDIGASDVSTGPSVGWRSESSIPHDTSRSSAWPARALPS